MWLLDANMDVHLLSFLRQCGLSVDGAVRRGWGVLQNGDLVAAAAAAGFTCILTRDRLFAESATGALKASPGFSIIVVELRQRPWRQYLDQVRAAWTTSPIRPAPGRVVFWPSEST